MVDTPSHLNIFSKAKQMFSDALEDVIYDVVGTKDEDFPQHTVKHSQQYLDDIVQGRWQLSQHVDTIDKSNLSNWDFKDEKINVNSKNLRSPLLKEIKIGAKLKHVKTNDKTSTIDKSLKSENILNKRKNLLNEIKSDHTLKPVTTTDKSCPYIHENEYDKLRTPSPPNSKKSNPPTLLGTIYEAVNEIPLVNHTKDILSEKIDEVKDAIGLIPSFPQSKVEHDRSYLNDIARGNWKPLNPVETNEKESLSYVGLKGTQVPKLNIFKPDRRSVFRAIEAGVPLKPALETNDRSKPVMPDNWHLKRIGDKRTEFLHEIEEYDRSELEHVDVVEKNFTPIVRKVESQKKELSFISKLVDAYDKFAGVTAYK